jgi:hypothetical protein
LDINSLPPKGNGISSKKRKDVFMKDKHDYMGKISFVYLLISLFCILFGAVYEYFSHEVYSYYMIYAFLFPLIGGTLSFSVLARFNFRHLPERLSINLYNSGIAALTVGSLFQGVLEIYGTTNALIRVYWFVGFAFLIMGLLLYLVGIWSTNSQTSFTEH